MVSNDEILAWLTKNRHKILGIVDRNEPPLECDMKLEGRPFVDGDTFAVEWVASFNHGGGPATTPAAARRYQFLGYAATGKPVVIRGSAVGQKVDDASSARTDGPIKARVYWNHASGMHQIGVRATGRPII